MSKIYGIHHITAIASDPNKCVDFYTKILGLRLVKKTVNQDQVEAYHLFFGDKLGEPGMDLTFFIFPGVGQGKRGVGVVSTISLVVRENSFDFWLDRFSQFNVKHEVVREKFDKKRIVFYDFDDQKLELVGVSDEVAEKMSVEVWVTDEIEYQNAIRSFYSARLSVQPNSMTEDILMNVLGYTQVDEYNNISQFKLSEHHRANFLEVELHEDEPLVFNAAGTVHHIAFAVKDLNSLELMREKLVNVGLYPTQVINRFWFKSVYFRIPSGILFELATMGPGFSIDEDTNHLGEKLILPPFLESQRKEIETNLEPIDE